MFTRLRWLSILVPVAIVAAIEIVSDTVLDEEMPFPVDALVIALVVFVTAATLSWLAFRQIGRLTGILERRNDELAIRTATARGLQEVAVSVAAGSELEPALTAVVERARTLLRTDVAVLVVAVPGMGHVRLVAPAGSHTPDVASDADVGSAFAAAGLEANVSSPIRVGPDAVGSLTAAAAGGRTFDVDDVETISALAGMAGVAVRNHELRGTMRELAVRGERERIAREMHDGLAQVLAYVSAKSAAADELLVAGRIPEARAQMADLGAAARSTYVDVREAILGLTTPVDTERGLAGALEEYGMRFADAAKIAVTVTASPAARSAHLAPEAEAQAFRIVQEALTNVRKHAHASRVSLALDVAPGALLVVVSDDGRGFTASADRPDDWPHYGQRTMIARAADVGGEVTWTSEPDGTRVELRLPLADRDPGTALAPAHFDGRPVAAPETN